MKQIQSKKRVSDFGEVYTNQREVNAMLDLVKPETERIDSTFLEPACGNGNFLEEILRRKLSATKTQYGNDPDEYERNVVIAISCIYGLDILMDNVEASRERLYKVWMDEYRAVVGKWPGKSCCGVVGLILERNIVCGNFLTMRLVGTDAKDTGAPIVLSSWNLSRDWKLEQTDFRLEDMLTGEDK